MTSKKKFAAVVLATGGISLLLWKKRENLEAFEEFLKGVRGK